MRIKQEPLEIYKLHAELADKSRPFGILNTR